MSQGRGLCIENRLLSHPNAKLLASEDPNEGTPMPDMGFPKLFRVNRYVPDSPMILNPRYTRWTRAWPSWCCGRQSTSTSTTSTEPSGTQAGVKTTAVRWALSAVLPTCARTATKNEDGVSVFRGACQYFGPTGAAAGRHRGKHGAARAARAVSRACFLLLPPHTWPVCRPRTTNDYM